MKKVFSIVLILFFTLLPAASQAQTGSFLDRLFNSESAPETVDRNDFTLDLIWKAHTFVPGDYRGKALGTNGSAITLVALTPTRNASGFEFTWIIEDSSSRTRGAELKGVGEDVFSFLAEPTLVGFEHLVRVTVQNIFTGESATARVTIPLQRPSLFMGTLSQEGSASLTSTRSASVSPGSTLSVIVKPFFFNVGGASSLSFSWFFDNTLVRGGRDTVFNLSVSPDSGTNITRELEVQARTPDGRRTSTDIPVTIQ